jgi:hypothetical protein
MGNNYSRLDLVIAIVLALIIAVWLIVYAALMILYGHDRSAGSAGRGDWRRETAVQISGLLRPTTNGIG